MKDRHNAVVVKFVSRIMLIFFSCFHLSDASPLLLGTVEYTFYMKLGKSIVGVDCVAGRFCLAGLTRV